MFKKTKLTIEQKLAELRQQLTSEANRICTQLAEARAMGELTIVLTLSEKAEDVYAVWDPHTHEMTIKWRVKV